MTDPAEKKPRQQLLIVQEGVDDAWIFEGQPNLPRIGEYITVFDKDGSTIMEGRAVDIRWAYIEEDNGSSCTITIRPEDR